MIFMGLKLKGQKINLRKLTKSDALSIYQNVKDKEISRFTNIPHPYTLKNAKSFIRRTHLGFRKKTAYELGIELESGQVVGGMSLLKVDHKNKNAEVGYWLGKKYWGQGIASESLKLILDFGFKKLKLVRIYARVMHPNTASAKLLEKAGFKYEGRMKQNFLKNGKWMDVLIYAILKEEYKKL